jgi:hypothetical protein
VRTSFVISNRDRTDRAYNWRIETGPGETISGSTPVPAGQQVRVSRLIWVRCAVRSKPVDARLGHGFMLRISLAASSEAITYHGRCDG